MAAVLKPLPVSSERLWEIARYLLVGGTLFAIDLFVWLFCVHILSWDMHLAQVLARTVGALAGFIGHKYISFRASGTDSLAIEGSGYLMVTVVNILISPIVLGAMVWLVPTDVLFGVVAKVLAEVVLVIWTYFLLRWIFTSRVQT